MVNLCDLAPQTTTSCSIVGFGWKWLGFILLHVWCQVMVWWVLRSGTPLDNIHGHPVLNSGLGSAAISTLVSHQAARASDHVILRGHQSAIVRKEALRVVTNLFRFLEVSEALEHVAADAFCWFRSISLDGAWLQAANWVDGIGRCHCRSQEFTGVLGWVRTSTLWSGCGRAAEMAAADG
jgi:hypothetical protein